MSDLIRSMIEDLKKLDGCGDGYCLITGKAKGMHTNGGCHCYRDKNRAQRFMRIVRKMIDSYER